MAADDVYKFDLEGIFSSKRWCTSFYFVQNEADSGGDAEAIAAEVGVQAKAGLWTATHMQSIVATDIFQDRYKCQRFGPTKATPTFVQYAAEAGIATGTSIANSTAPVITKYPFFWDRDFICRNYYPPPPDSVESYNRFTTAGLAIWVGVVPSDILATLAIATPEVLTFDQVCLSQKRYKDFLDPVTPPIPWTSVFSKVKSVVVQTVLGTQRRRRPPRDSAPA